MVASARKAAASVLLAFLGLSSLTAQAQAATNVGEARCLTCHKAENEHFSDTYHARIFRGNPKTAQERLVCEACHGPGSKHVEKTGDKTTIIAFTRGSATPIPVQNAQCLNCHGGAQRQHWSGSAHERNNLACSDCHAPMEKRSRSGLLRKPTITDTCLTCHQERRAEFQRRSHMPVLEGKMSCADCHNPHGAITRPLLKNDSVVETCTACHAEKRGPFLWEHAPVRENCANCHLPHGSNNERLLVSARPYLCQQCHSPPVGHPGQFFRADQTAAAARQGGAQSARVIGRSCQNCHSAVHGSNHPSGARLQR
jgi:DmsE family decaheme c-type cytochrome